jgi:hypothetical protein
VLLRLAYLGLTNTLALLRLLPMTDRDKDVDILTLRHQIGVLQRQLGGARVRFTSADRALLAALLHRLPRETLRRFVCWCARTLSCVGTANCWRDATPWHPVRSARDDLALSGPSASSSYGRPRRIPVGATGESTVSSSFWA